MKEIDQKIIDAILKKAEKEYSGVVDLLGIYGSVCTNDTHDHSDLDLLILINDPRGYGLSKAFILEDVGIGYDVYCTTYEMLEEDATCGHTHLSKIMDSEIVYVRDESVTARLEELRQQVRETLGSGKRFEAIDQIRDEICKHYGYAFTAETIGQLRTRSAWIINLCLDAVMLWNGSYFKRGVKRTFEELEGLDLPDDFIKNIMAIVQARNFIDLGISLGTLVKSVIRFTYHGHIAQEPTKDSLRGTYEESYSNWRNKMQEAVREKDVFSSFMNLASLQFMFEGIASENNIPRFQVMDEFDAQDLVGNAKLFDDALAEYQKEYEKVGLTVQSFANVDEFVKAYV